MVSGLTILGESSLRFFGEMSAANAHEIKNALAVINENAGLLADLVAMAEKGADLSHERLKRLAAKVKCQVARADEIAKSTNRFAHSVDNVHGPADLEQSLKLIKTMAMRNATKRHIDIEVVPYRSSITLPVQPFMLLHLLWECLQCAMEATNAEKTIEVAMIRTGEKTVVRFGPLSHLAPEAVTALSETEKVRVLLQLLNAQIAADEQKEDLLLTFIKSEEMESS